MWSSLSIVQPCCLSVCLCPQHLKLLVRPVKYKRSLPLFLQVGDDICGYTVLHVSLLLGSCITLGISWLVVLYHWLVVLLACAVVGT